MCAVSMVIGDWTNPRGPNWIPQEKIDPSTAIQMLEIIKRLDALDKKLGFVDCKIEELEKQRFIKGLKQKVRKRK